ncbi:hypothetical protein TNCV_1011331 [Trichonephila clavipes]|uniref:Uncharacterized protein n=1 Tax=Trichonephila clavipes TaxID=2585209 RepID=A0A8X6VX39_TRICX|nr:hypothetical protein TNCV_1011331 [Trichonephila clavipes]
MSRLDLILDVIEESVKETPNHEIPSNQSIIWRKTSVAMYNATLQQTLTTMSLNSNPTIVMLQVEAGSISKHNVFPFRCQWTPFIVPMAKQTPVVSSQETKEAMNALRTFHSAANDVKCYDRTSNDA